MDKTIDVQELQKDVDRVVEEVTQAHTPYILTRASQPMAVMIAYEDYVKLLPPNEVWARFKERWAALGERNIQYSEEEVEADLESATRELRERRNNA
jgi:prevent-host-death family protein